MKTLEKITEFDNEILYKISILFDNKKNINNFGINNLYKNLFKNYSELNNIEALKRAIFIQWYSVIEPPENTGIGSLDDKIEKNNISKVNNLYKLELLDNEFIFFLIHYYNLTGWYFDNLNLNLKILEINNLKKNEFTSTFKGRGVMGNYWSDLI